MARRINRLNVECLESRELMAGDIVATIANGNLFLNEARFQSGQSNLVKVSQLSSGAIRVAGLTDANGDRTLVNGAAFRDFALPAGGGLLAVLGAGNDNLFVQNVKKFNTINVDVGRPLVDDTDLVNISVGTRTRGEVRIATGGGTDSVFIQDAQIGDGIGAEDLIIDSGAGADVVNIAGGVRTRAGVRINSGEGTDSVLIRGARIGDGIGPQAEDLNILTGTGADSVVLGLGEAVTVRGNLQLNTFDAAETDADVVRMLQTTVFKTLAVNTGAGDDIMTLGLVSAKDMVLIGGEGNDTAKLFEVSVGNQLFVDMAGGNDTLDLTGVNVLGSVSANGGAGSDRLSILLSPVANPNFIGWEVVNGFQLPQTTLGLGGGDGGVFAP